MFDWDEAASVMSGRWAGQPRVPHFTSVSIDSRSVQPGALFVCLKGQNHDGHLFTRSAIENGAVGILLEDNAAADIPAGAATIRVPHTLEALGRLAKAWRRKLNPTLVAVTGSSGKTSTKEMLAAYLNRFGAVSKTEANHNNELGVPLTLLGLRSEHRFAVVEMGMRGKGEIAYLAAMAEPDVGVITNIGTAHIERLGSREAIASAKAELWNSLKPGAVAIVPLDDAYATREASVWGGGQVTWSLDDPAATVWASDVHGTTSGGQVFTVYWKEGQGNPFGRAEVKIPFWGDHHRANALAALAAGWALGLLPDNRIELRPDSLPGRSRRLEWRGVSIVDDSYNANPDSMRAALQAFSEIIGEGRRFAVLGEMAELGSFGAEAHREIACFAESCGLDGLVLVGEGSKAYLAGVSEGSLVTWCPEPEAAARHLVALLKPGDQVLLKASRSVGLERFLEYLPRVSREGNP
jgi:UDP-N-acetylmuramoyl-tripeptide--D-alanyl-D-alanine ligase